MSYWWWRERLPTNLSVIDATYTALQLTHMVVFGLLLFNKEWRVTAGFLLLSAILYHNAGPYIATLGEPMYLTRALIDVCFGLAIILSPTFIRWAGLQKFAGRGGTFIQPLILFVFALYHSMAFLALKVGFYAFFGSVEISLYVWVTNALNLAQILVAVGVIGDVVVRFIRGVGDAIRYSGRPSGARHTFVERAKGHQER